MFAGDAVPNTTTWYGAATIWAIEAAWGISVVVRARPPLTGRPRALVLPRLVPGVGRVVALATGDAREHRGAGGLRAGRLRDRVDALLAPDPRRREHRVPLGRRPLPGLRGPWWPSSWAPHRADLDRLRRPGHPGRLLLLARRAVHRRTHPGSAGNATCWRWSPCSRRSPSRCSSSTAGCAGPGGRVAGRGGRHPAAHPVLDGVPGRGRGGRCPPGRPVDPTRPERAPGTACARGGRRPGRLVVAARRRAFRCWRCSAVRPT